MQPVSNSGLVYEAGNYAAGNAPQSAYGSQAPAAYGPGGPPSPNQSSGGPDAGTPITTQQLVAMKSQPMSLSNPPAPQTKGDWIVLNDLVTAFSAKDPQAQIYGMTKAATDAVQLLPPSVQAAYVQYLKKASQSNSVPDIKKLNAFIVKKLIEAQKQGQPINVGPFTLWYLDLFTMITSKGGRAMLTKQTGMSQLGASQPTESPLAASAMILNSPQSQSAQLQATSQSQSQQQQPWNPNRQN
jgi:hypothetical protein